MRPALASLLLLIACGSAPEERPEAVVHRFFGAVAARDCATMLASIGGSLEERVRRVGCESLIRELEEHRTTFEGIDEIEPDGRDRSARLVRARLLVGDRTRRVLLRVEPRDGRWVLVVL